MTTITDDAVIVPHLCVLQLNANQRIGFPPLYPERVAERAKVLRHVKRRCPNRRRQQSAPERILPPAPTKDKPWRSRGSDGGEGSRRL